MNKLKISFILNEKIVTPEIYPDATALEVIRDIYKLSGTKESCSEGDCGACTIALGTLAGDQMAYLSVTSCIYPAAKLHGKHVLTIEGLGDENNLTLIQKAMLENHATQCGYCTPGIVMSLFCLFYNNATPSEEEVSAALEGNLCRCTGYESIKRSVVQIKEDLAKNLAESGLKFQPEYIDNVIKILKSFDYKLLTLPVNNENLIHECQNYFIPQDRKELFATLEILPEKAKKKIIGGGTDLVVEANVRRMRQQYLIDISRIIDFDGIAVNEGWVSIGANVTLTEIQANPDVQNYFPVLCETIRQMSSQQIRNVATLAGNIGNASPIADSIPTLLVLDAELELYAKTGTRTVKLDEYYLGYKKTVLQSNEIIGRIKIPIPTQKVLSRFEKTAKRVAVDISSVSSAIALTVSGNKICSCKIAFGGVAAIPVLLTKTSEFLVNKEVNQELLIQAGISAMQEVAPIGDVRGSAEYRSLLVKNHLIKHLNTLLEVEA